jgi:hypothetical protein
VQREGDDRFVYVDESGRLARRTVLVGVREAGVTEIKKGLTAADRIVTSSVTSSTPRTLPKG